MIVPVIQDLAAVSLRQRGGLQANAAPSRLRLARPEYRQYSFSQVIAAYQFLHVNGKVSYATGSLVVGAGRFTALPGLVKVNMSNDSTLKD